MTTPPDPHGPPERDDTPPPDPPPGPPPGPPELQHLLRRMQSAEEQPDQSGEESNEFLHIDRQLLYTKVLLQFILVPAVFFGPDLAFPGNALACGAAGGLALILGYLEALDRNRWFSAFCVVMGLLLMVSGLSSWLSGGQVSGSPTGLG